MKKWKDPLLFCLGGAGYVGLELLWRGRSHGSMFLAGGSCFLLLGKLRRRLPDSIPLRGVAGSGIITGVELVTGLVFNRQFQVWDYRQLPLNFLGQICALYSALWVPVGLGAMELYRAVDSRI